MPRRGRPGIHIPETCPNWAKASGIWIPGSRAVPAPRNDNFWITGVLPAHDPSYRLQPIDVTLPPRLTGLRIAQAGEGAMRVSLKALFAGLAFGALIGLAAPA